MHCGMGPTIAFLSVQYVHCVHTDYERRLRVLIERSLHPTGSRLSKYSRKQGYFESRLSNPSTLPDEC